MIGHDALGRAHRARGGQDLAQVAGQATPEHDQLREAVRDFLAAEAAMPAVRWAMSAGYDRGLWRRRAAEIGVAGLAVPAEFGGAGCGFLEVAVV